MTANGIGTAASVAMRTWWMERGVSTPAQAQACMQGVDQGTHPEIRYGAIDAQIAEDLMNAGAASRLLLQDLNAGRADDDIQPDNERHHNRADGSVDHEAASRPCERLLNEQDWRDEEACLCDAI